jgi:hypothetical protein
MTVAEMQIKSDTVTQDTRYYPIISDVIKNIDLIQLITIALSID